MNKMIQRQDIVPPWIEKQQELVKTANVFRGRLRADWVRPDSLFRILMAKSRELATRTTHFYLYANDLNRNVMLPE